MDRTPRQYTEACLSALQANYHNTLAPGARYHGKEGALLLAREYGYGLGDWPESEHKDMIGSSYGILLVRATNLQPPIDAKPWAQEIIKAIAQRNMAS